MGPIVSEKTIFLTDLVYDTILQSLPIRVKPLGMSPSLNGEDTPFELNKVAEMISENTLVGSLSTKEHTAVSHL